MKVMRRRRDSCAPQAENLERFRCLRHHKTVENLLFDAVERPSCARKTVRSWVAERKQVPAAPRNFSQSRVLERSRCLRHHKTVENLMFEAVESPSCARKTVRTWVAERKQVPAAPRNFSQSRVLERSRCLRHRKTVENLMFEAVESPSCARKTVR